MEHPSSYIDALKCIRNRRYTPAASFMVKGMVEKSVNRIPTEQIFNLTITIARKLRNTHARLLMSQSGGVPLRVMAEQAYREVETAMTAAPGGAASAPATG